MKARLLLFAYRIRMTCLAKNGSCPVARGPVPRERQIGNEGCGCMKRPGCRSAGACPPRVSEAANDGEGQALALR